MINILTEMDGTLWIPRHDKEAIEYLDAHYQRINKNQLRWRTKNPSLLEMFKDVHIEKRVGIIGKGPSLDNFTVEHFIDSDIFICLNDSIHKFEELGIDKPTYCTQLDSHLEETCQPKNAKLIVGPRCSHLYGNKLVVDPCWFGLADDIISAVFAIMLARHMGCVTANMYGFDGCLGQSYDYAKCIGYSPTNQGTPMRFKNHKPLIINACKNRIALNWFTAKGDGTLSVTNLG